MRAETKVIVAFAITALGSVSLGVTYVLGGQPQVEGALLALSLGALGVGLVIWAHQILGDMPEVEERHPLPSPEEDRVRVVDDLSAGDADPSRRRALRWMLGAAVGGLGFAAIFPLRSLGPSPGNALFTTAWKRGVRLVDERGDPVSLDTLADGGIMTVWPEGSMNRADSIAILLRVRPEKLHLAPDRTGWAPDGHIAYSKICTHAGCPVGLFQEETNILLCPCHQSGFNVLDAARPVFGPAARPLPQLPLELDADGYLVAAGELSAPVGAGFWNRPS